MSSTDSQIGDLDNPTPVSTETEEVKSVETSEAKTEKNFVSILRSNPLYEDASSIFHWRDPLRAGLLFGIFNFFLLADHLGRIFCGDAHQLFTFGTDFGLLFIC